MEVPSPVAPLDLAPPDELGTGVPPPPSPLSGCYLLIVIGEPYSQEHKDIILQRIAKGFLSWDSQASLVDLEKELQALTVQAPEGEEAKNGERLIQYATENLVTEVLIHPQINTLVQCVRNLLSSFTRHRHLIHAGYTFAGNGSWILQDGTFSLADFTDAFQEVEVQRVLRAYENCVTVDVHCSPDGDWTTERLSREPFSRSCKVRVNPDDRLTAGSAPIANFINYISPFLKPASIENLLEPSEVVGNIRFSHPTLYVFPGGQGDAALFGINGFNMLVDGGFARKACFWDFARHLDRLDAVLVTRLNNGNVNGISSVLRRKKQAHVYPQIGHFFCNLQERRHAASPDGDKDRDPLLINLADEGQEMVQNLRQMQLKPHSCYREGNYVEPVNLYHKVGHGKLDMYIISPTKDSREVKEFLAKWNTNDARLFTGPKKDAKEFCFPLQNLISICALLVWQPANPNDTITRILFPGSSPQHKIFEGLEKLKHLEFLKFPVCSMKSISPSGSTVGISSKVGTKLKSAPAVLDKLLPGEKDIIKEASQKTASLEANKQVKSATIPVVPDVKSTKYAPLAATTPLTKALPQIKNKIERPTSKPDPIKKTEANKSLDGDKSTVKTERATKPTEKKTEIKSKLDKTSSIKSRIEAKSPRIVERKVQKATTPTVEKKSEKSSPTTPKKTIESKTNGVASKNEIGKTSRSASKGRPSPTATPAKSAKDANNRKVVESKINVARVSSTARAMAKPTKAEESAKQERKPITRKPKTAPSPIKRAPSSPAKSSSVKSTPSVSVKSEKDGVIRKIKTDDKMATDSSAVSTPSTADPDKTIIKTEEMEEKPSEAIVEAEVVQEVATEVEAKPTEEEEEDAKDKSVTSEKAEDEEEEDTGNKATDEDVDSKDTVEEEIVVEEVNVDEQTIEKPDDSDMVNEDDVGDNKEDGNNLIEPSESLQQAMNLGDKRGEIENEEEDAEGAEEDEEYLIVEKEEVDDSLHDQESADVGKEGDMEDDGELKKQRDEVESEKENKDVKQDELDGVQDIDDANINKETKEDLDDNEAIVIETKEVDSDEGIDIKEEKLVQKEDGELEDNIIEDVEDKDAKEETKDEAEDDTREIDTVETKVEKGDLISPENKEQLEEEVREIISSAKEIISKSQLENDTKVEDEEEEDEGKEGVSDKRKSEEGDEQKEVSSTSPEEKMDHSSEKNRETTEDNRETTEDNKEITEDTRDTDQRILDQEHDEYEVKRAASREIANQKYPAEDSQPDEKFSTTVESAATTAPTLPEDERIPLDEIKEIIEEKHVKEETKEKEVPEVVLMPRHEQPTTLPQVVVPGSAPVFPPHGVIHHRDIVKTPDEVADLPMHEEVDPGMYESDEFARDFHKGKDDSGSSKKESDELRHLSPELDIKGELQLKDEEKKLEADGKEVEVEERVAVEETVQTTTKVLETEAQPIYEEVAQQDTDVEEKGADNNTEDIKILEDVCKDEEPLDSTLPDESTEIEVKSIDKHALSETEEEDGEKGTIPLTEEVKPDSTDPCEIQDLAEPMSILPGETVKEDSPNEVAQLNEVLEETGGDEIIPQSEMPKDEPASKDLAEDGQIVLDDKIDCIKQVTMSFIEAETSAIVNENPPQDQLESQTQVDSVIVDEKDDDDDKPVTSTEPVTNKLSDDTIMVNNVHGDTQEATLETDTDHQKLENADCDTKLNVHDDEDKELICEKQQVEDVKEIPEPLSRVQGIEEIQDVVHSEDIHAPMTVSKETVEEQLQESVPPSELSATYLDIIDQVQQGETKPNLPSQDTEEIKILDEKTEAASDIVADEERAKSASPEIKTELDLKEGSQEHLATNIPSKSADEHGIPATTVDEDDQLQTSDIPESNKELLGKEETKEMDASEILEKSTEDERDVKESKDVDIDTLEIQVDGEVDDKLIDDKGISDTVEESGSEKGDHNVEDELKVGDEVVKQSGDNEGITENVDHGVPGKDDEDEGEELKVDEGINEKVDHSTTGIDDQEKEEELKVDEEAVTKSGDDEGINEKVDDGATEKDETDREDLLEVKGEVVKQSGEDEGITNKVDAKATENGVHDVDEEDMPKKHEEDPGLKEPAPENLDITVQEKDIDTASKSATPSPKHELIVESGDDMDKINVKLSDVGEVLNEKDAHENVETKPEHDGPDKVVSAITENLNGIEHEENDAEEKEEKTDILDAVKSTVDSLVSSFTDFGNDLLGKSDDKESDDTKIEEKQVTDIDAKTEQDGDKVGDVEIENIDEGQKEMKEIVTNEASVLDGLVDICKTAVDNIAEKITEQTEKVMQVCKSEVDEATKQETEDEINIESNEGVCQEDIPVNGMENDIDEEAEMDLPVVDKSLDIVKSYIDDVKSHIDDAKSKLEDAKSHLDEEKSTLIKQSILSDLNRNESSEALAIVTGSESMSALEPEEESMKPMGSPKLVEFLVGDEKIVITDTEKKQKSDEELKETSDAIEQSQTENDTEVATVKPETASDETDKSSVTSTIATSEPENVLKPEQETSQATSDTDSDNAGTVKRMLVTASSEDGGAETEVCPTGSINFSTSLSTKPSSDNLTSMLPDDSKEGIETSLEKETAIPTVNTYDIDGWRTDHKLSNLTEDKSDEDTTLDKKEDKDIAQQKHDDKTNEENIETTETPITATSIEEKVELVMQIPETKDTIEAVNEILFEKSRTPSPTKSEPERADSRASSKCLEDTTNLDASVERFETSVADTEAAPGKTTVTTVFTGLPKDDSEHIVRPESSASTKENEDTTLSASEAQKESNIFGGISGFIKSAVNTGKEFVQEIGNSIGTADVKTEDEIENEIEKIVSTEKVHEMVIDARTEVGNLITETSRISELAAGASGLIASVKKEDVNRSGTPGSDDIDMGGPLSPLSDISSGQVSRVPDIGHCDSDVDDDIVGSPVSTTSLLANSPLPSHFQYEIGDSHSSQPIDIRHTSSSLHYDPEHAMEFGTKHKDIPLQMDSSMSSSFYGQLPPDPLQQLLEEREEQEASAVSIVQSTRDPMTSSFYATRQEFTTDPKYESGFSHVMAAGDQNISSHVGGFDDESEDLDFERAMHEHRTARGKDLTPSPTKTYRQEIKFQSNGDSPTHTSKYQHHTNGQNGKHHDDDLDDFSTNNGGDRHFDEPLHTKEKMNGKSESHTISSDSQMASSTYQKEIFPTSPVKEVPGKVVISITASGAEHDPTFHPQVVTSATLPDLPQGFGISPGESSTGDVGLSKEKQDPIQGWGKPLGLPSPAPPPTSNGEVTATNKSTPKKEKKPLLIKKSLTTENNKTSQKEGVGKKRPESPVKLAKKGVSNKDDGRGAKATGNPIYMDLTYVPHHGNSYYSNVEFFKKVRARYYVFSGTEPSREVYNALLEAKQTWDDKELEVTIIPTYDTDTLGYWVAENEDILAKHKIDLSPSASRCTINLQDHETSCSAYRLEF